jgi:hypothetical protein
MPQRSAVRRVSRAIANAIHALLRCEEEGRAIVRARFVRRAVKRRDMSRAKRKRDAAISLMSVRCTRAGVSGGPERGPFALL